jgi:DNA-binding SARP family transcriptional activator
VIRIVLAESGRLIGQGRWQVVVDWIRSLPPEVVDGNCWLLHWLGTARIAIDPERARDSLERSFDVATLAADTMCQLQTAAGIIQTYLQEYAQFRPMDRWLEVLRTKLGDNPIFHDEDSELRARSALLIGLLYRRPDDPRARDCAEATFRLLRGHAGANLRVTSAAYLSMYGGWAAMDVARRAIPILDELISHPEVTPPAAGWALFVSAFVHMADCDEKKSRDALTRLKRLGMEHGMPGMVRLAAVIGTNLELGAGRLSIAREWIDTLSKVTAPNRPYDQASLEQLRAWVAAYDGRVEGADGPIGRAVRFYDEAGTHIHRCFSRVQHAVVCALQGQVQEAERWISEALDFARALSNTWLEVEVRLGAAVVALERNHLPGAHEHMRHAFAVAKQEGTLWPFKWMRRWIPQLCELALEGGIERDFVRRVIRELGLSPASAGRVMWPWPIKIYALGEFRLLVDEQPLQFGRKAPRRLLRVLKALVALGGREVPLERLADALWTEAEGDAGLEACEKAVHRLRTLLKLPEAIRIESGKVSLDDTMVWSDCRALEEVFTHGLSNGDAVSSILGLYRGEFLSDEPDAPWALATREALRNKFIYSIEQAAVSLESAQRNSDAIALYLRGLDADTMSEAFYQGLMRCHSAMGNRAEALNVYRRMRRQLSATLQVEPSASSEALARKLRLQ